ncbi:MAG: LysR family transcriptional regulator [Aeromonadaceae bacterium]|nr:LysR family transcriptional regulator [Aeromonadaceae bacterium]
MGGSLADVRAFCRVVELGTLSAAARVLGETKGSISRRLRRLEQSLGLSLLARHPRSVSVTGEGQLFYGKAREGLLLLEEAAELARAHRSEPRGVLRITAPLDLGQEWLPPIIVAFARQYPQIRVELLLSDQRLDLASHQIDVALRATEGGLPDMGYSARPLTSLTMGWFAAPDYLAQASAPVCPEDLHGHALSPDRGGGSGLSGASAPRGGGGAVDPLAQAADPGLCQRLALDPVRWRAGLDAVPGGGTGRGTWRLAACAHRLAGAGGRAVSHHP